MRMGRNKKMNRWIRRVYNWAGRHSGYGECLACQDSWLWKAHKRSTISYKTGHSMFPVCGECFAELSPEEILGYVYVLMMRWRKTKVYHRLKERILAEIKQMKETPDST